MSRLQETDPLLQTTTNYQSSDEDQLEDSNPELIPSKEAAGSQSDSTLDSSSAFIISSSSLRLLVYLLLSVVVAVGNAISWKRTLNRFRAIDGSQKNLELFVTQWSIFLYVVIAASILLYRWRFTSLISPQQRDYPQYKFVLMGVLDAVAGLCSSLGGAFSTGQQQTIINQANIPVTMILSHLTLQTRYDISQYIGAALIVIGSLSAAATSYNSQQSELSLVLWYGPLILLLSTIPNSWSNVYKEKNFKQEGLDVYYLTTFVSFYQVLLGFFFSPILAIPGLGGLAINEIPHNFYQGWQCFFGEEIEGFDCHVPPFPYLIFLLYVIINFFYNVLLLLITKHGSALLLVISSAVSLPITNIVFTVDWLMGKDRESWSWGNCIGLIVVVIGFLLYSLVGDSETGEILPAQQAAGQMMYIADSDHHHSLLALGESEQRLIKRRHSFDVASSPLVVALALQRKLAAQQRFLDGQNRSSDKIFFTPPTDSAISTFINREQQSQSG